MTAEPNFQPFKVNVRIKISALWTSMLFVFAYVDLFSLYRPDFRAEWNYYIVGSAIEVALLATIVYYAWTWPRSGRETVRSS